MKKALYVSVVTILLVTLAFVSFTYAQEKIQLKVSNWFPVGVGQDILLKEWGTDLEKKTNGRVKVKYYQGGILIPAAQSYDGVVKGIADVSQHVAAYTAGRFPMIELLNLLHGYPNGSIATKLANDYYQKFRPKELDPVKVLWLHAQGPGLLFTKTKPVNKLEDIKGLKIRGFTCNVKYLSLLGAAPVTMPMGDVYDALSKGVADGITAAYETMENWKLADLIRYAMEDYEIAYTSVFLVVMNKQKWDSLPKDIQAIIDSMSPEYIEKSAKMWDKIDESGKKYLISKGGKIITHSKEEQARWVEKAKPVMEEWTSEAEKKGLPGKEAMKYIQTSLEKYKSTTKKPN